MIDTHTHLYFRENYPDGGEAAVKRALEAGVDAMIFPNVSLESALPLIELYRNSPAGTTFAAAGMHPEDIDNDWKAKTDEVFAMFEDIPIVAVGEVGIDLYHDATYRLQQMDAFGYQMDRALQTGVPVIVHCRSALDEVLTVAAHFPAAERPRLLFHSFTSGKPEAERVMTAIEDAVFGINGVVTFKNAPEVREAVNAIPLDRIVLETDAPYLAPVPKRGRTNESSYLGYIRDKIAEVKGVTPEDVETATTGRAREFFKI